MADQKLLDILRSQLAAHVPEAEIIAHATAQGFAEADVHGALAILRIQQAPTMGGHIQKAPEQSAPTSHLVAHIALLVIFFSVSATAYGYFINTGIPILSGYTSAIEDLKNLPETIDNIGKITPKVTTGVTNQTSASGNVVKVNHPSGYTLITKGTASTPTEAAPVAPATPAAPATPEVPLGPAVVPTLSITTQYSSITRGTRMTIYWSSTDTDICTSKDLSIGYRTHGSISIRPNVTTSYLITCEGRGGSVSQSVTVGVSSSVIVATAGDTTTSTPAPSPSPSPAPGSKPGPNPVPPPTPVPPPPPPPPQGGPYSMYSGCEAPATTYTRTIYIDPAAGLDTGDGSQAKPFKTIGNVLSQKKLAQGDHVILMAGNQGAVYVKANSSPLLANGTKWIWLDFQPGATVTSINAGGMSRWLITNATVSSQIATLVDIQDGTNFVIADSSIYTAKNSSSWSIAQWMDAALGISTRETTCISVLRNQVTNVRHGILVFTNKTSGDMSIKGLVLGNVVKNFSGDGMRPIGSDIIMSNNQILDSYVGMSDGDGNHDDAIQMYALNGAAFKNVTIENNWIQETTNPSRPYQSSIQGINDFSGHLSNLRVANNVVLISATHGITDTGIHDSIIENNTVFNPTNNGKRTWIYMSDVGQPVTNTIVRNNIATHLLTPWPAGVTATNNYEFSDPTAIFQNFDRANASFDVRIKPGSAADGKGLGASLSNPLARADTEVRIAQTVQPGMAQKLVASVAESGTDLFSWFAHLFSAIGNWFARLF